MSSASSSVDDGLVFLPQASSAIELLVVSLYLSLALVAACRASSFHSQRSTFQRLMVLFAVTRAASFLTQGLARNLLNRAALCLFFSLVLFQTLLWLDIANPKVSRRSRRLWIAFLLVNGLFYATVLGLAVLHEAKVAEAAHANARLNRSTLWTGVLPWREYSSLQGTDYDADWTNE
ncbi:Type I inositol-3,4-bisphosphate 4-phosphatase [Phytophthora palmivora]|uniref:Type I inositol-3,4-bisphosphate 4-phosphatase n=1 Tax=Phytophthora palmivora TaxID=4796 RepID=A0A2P4Y294_9STRA|nr:Type I inositol-3,4-bisphosphate 4-phosphatase [Phytophthora palmivora]